MYVGAWEELAALTLHACHRSHLHGSQSGPISTQAGQGLQNGLSVGMRVPAGVHAWALVQALVLGPHAGSIQGVAAAARHAKSCAW